MNTLQVANVLTEQYPWNRFDFGIRDKGEHFKEWVWRYASACILCANEREANVLAICELLFEVYPHWYEMAEAHPEELADLLKNRIKPDRCRRKAESLIALAKICTEDGVPVTKEEFKKVPGIGEHMSAVMRATCYSAPEFAVDVHVRRILKRMGLVDEKMSDKKIEAQIKEEVPAEMLGHFSRSFVDFGQDICGYYPKCNQCQFDCPKKEFK